MSIKYFLPKICTKEIGYGNAYYSCLNPDLETVNPDFGFEFGSRNPDLTPDLKSGFEALTAMLITLDIFADCFLHYSRKR